MILGKTIKMSQRSDGFTLVEALLSVAILGLLAATMGTIYSSANLSLAVQKDHILFDSMLRSRMEYLMGTPFDTLGDGSEDVTINGSNYQIAWTVVPIDLDGDSNPESTAKQVTVSLSIGGSGESESVSLDKVVENNSDDAEEQDTGNMLLTSNSLYYGGLRYVGSRFLNVTIPPGATINNAYVEIQSPNVTTGNMEVTIQGEDIADAATFSSSNNDMSNRSKTDASVAWNVGEDWSTGQKYQTPDISPIIKEIVDLPGWSSGNAMVILYGSTGIGARDGVSYDDDPGNAALLHVEYSEGGGPVTGPSIRSLTTIRVDNEDLVGKIS